MNTDRLVIPVPSLVLLIGPSGAGKSTWAARHFGPYEVVSSDQCRAMIADSEADQSVTPAAFDLLRYIAQRRIDAGRLVIIDATNVDPNARRRSLDLALTSSVPAIAVVFNVSLEWLKANNARRPGRVVEESVIHHQYKDLELSLPLLPSEGFAKIYILDEASLEDVSIERR
jgi:predicted kinase